MRLLIATLLAAASLCAQAAEPVRYGAAFEAGPDIPVAQAIAGFDRHAGAPQRFSGRITEVCQAEGCWLMLEDNGQAARVMFRDHAFLVPKDSTGSAVVHGVLERRELTAEQARHFAEDSGKPVQASPVEYRIIADGVLIQS